jgi:hypothetical protein
MALSQTNSRSAIKIALLSSYLLGALGASSAALADNQQMQMLPPTTFGKSDLCDQNQILVYTGTGGRDSSNKQISAINCLTTGLSVVPSTGDVWLGTSFTSPNRTEQSYYKNIVEYSPSLHFSGSTGPNSDDIYFQRKNDLSDVSELQLVIGDNAVSPFNPTTGYGDAFVIGAVESSQNYQWYPRFTFTGEGKLGIGTTNPSQKLEVVGVEGDDGFIYNNKPEGGFLFGTQGRHSGGGLGLTATAGGWSLDSDRGDVNLRAIQGGGINFSTSTVVGSDSGDHVYTRVRTH